MIVCYINCIIKILNVRFEQEYKKSHDLSSRVALLYIIVIIFIDL